ncbi:MULTISPECIES: tryptophan--tRNA ligase [Desulfococcus]|uniref:Tryptophan--tRNA ligase n=1 Tax=Desulfococcus multivorans DSM 2059 TaxID=1121405 RepID=S7TLQ6_DESML|nr:tryptophan--tRNA ligase [Desulfococcus multivorans]AOY59691.1 TrpS: tryptophanyl-tRNA synthetase [Desulfococcus multivorans]AQV01872.1 tryptophan--tRNA ligase [Desulfococcus multivorans]EPR37821.1 tryptophanyl-tRNA synthetase [Desulfococcus multivorans DSM 2059]SKA17240.1 tryptophanyl-tRNA synthetase [Desulfococcus multivorans DSM 2059]
MADKKRILSGMRPTGPLHLGNLHGALENWIDMQERYDCFFFIADWHALTSNYEHPEKIPDYVKQMMIDWLSVGLSPEKSTLFVQSHIKEHAELFLLLAMITPVPWLERVPTYKDQIVQLAGKDLSTYGFLGYPLLQAADIIIYKADGVPVGVDQVPHVEITREIARRFNYLYREIFPEPQAILTETSKILGWDRRKMSKSYDNAIYLSDSPEEIMEKVSKFVTDPARKLKSDPGNPDICNVFDFHKLYSPKETVDEIRHQCRSAQIGCVACKKKMAKNLIAFLEPIREKRAYYEKRPELLAEIILTGGNKARESAQRTMEEVRAAMSI